MIRVKYKVRPRVTLYPILDDITYDVSGKLKIEIFNEIVIRTSITNEQAQFLRVVRTLWNH